MTEWPPLTFRRATSAAPWKPRSRPFTLWPTDGDAWIVIADQGPGTFPDPVMQLLFAKAAPLFLANPGAFGGGVPPATIAQYLAKMGASVKAPADQVAKLNAFARQYGPK